MKKNEPHSNEALKRSQALRKKKPEDIRQLVDEKVEEFEFRKLYNKITEQFLDAQSPDRRLKRSSRSSLVTDSQRSVNRAVKKDEEEQSPSKKDTTSEVIDSSEGSESIQSSTEKGINTDYVMNELGCTNRLILQ